MKTYSDYLNDIFPGVKVQKISVNAGFSCPNRDGTIGTGGCSYCRNDSFSPSYCTSPGSVESQIKTGKDFFRKKYPEMKYLAYFQSYTNTYGKEPAAIRALYQEAIGCEDVVGIVIGTRPDTLPDQTLDMLEELTRETVVFLEIGAETSCDETLRLINRHHTWEDVRSAVGRASARNIHCGLHLIAGLPGEDCSQVIRNVKEACSLPIETLKLHQLQILFGTPLFSQWEKGEIELKPYTLDEYLELCAKIVGIVPPNIVIERFLSQSPPQMVAAPKWGLKNYQFMNLLDRILS
ncbi:MAG: TIGR01212 family radical SAM protein [Muribaculaceae bacterium]|nr:TIGR01212 family radical SAM protein [Muribaculaceae bacterium]